MSQPPAGASDAGIDPTQDPAGRFTVQPNGRVRPLSPHMQVWRWHVTMLASILFRFTIGAASAGAIVLVAWLGALAFGPEAYSAFLGLAASPVGLLVGVGLTLVLFSFLLNGGRHLINDAGRGLDLKPANLMSALTAWGPPVLTAIFWIALFFTGKVSL